MKIKVIIIISLLLLVCFDHDEVGKANERAKRSELREGEALEHNAV
jgi:hypothetical protein